MKVVRVKDPPEPIRHYLGVDYQREAIGEGSKMSMSQPGLLQQALDEYHRSCETRPWRSVETPQLEREASEAEEGEPGQYKEAATRVCMKLLYAARLTRPDLMEPLLRLTRSFTHWNKFHDLQFRRLLDFVSSTLHQRLEFFAEGCVKPEDMILHLRTDADLAGCKRTGRSTTGYVLTLRDKSGKFFGVLDYASRRQGCTASSTAESELVAMAAGIRESLVPMVDFLSALFGEDTITCMVQGDNTAALTVVQTGTTTLKHLRRAHRISVSQIRDHINLINARVGHVGSAFNSSDIMTKSLGRALLRYHSAALGLFDASNSHNPAKYWTFDHSAEYKLRERTFDISVGDCDSHAAACGSLAEHVVHAGDRVRDGSLRGSDAREEGDHDGFADYHHGARARRPAATAASIAATAASCRKPSDRVATSANPEATNGTAVAGKGAAAHVREPLRVGTTAAAVAGGQQRRNPAAWAVDDATSCREPARTTRRSARAHAVYA